MRPPGFVALAALAACTEGSAELHHELRAGDPRGIATDAMPTASAIRHLIVIVQENHTFDSYFGRYCEGPAGATCAIGRLCCEAAPERVAGCTAGTVDDDYNRGNDPDHNANTEFWRMDLASGGFRMDRYPCADVAYAAVPDASYQQGGLVAPDDRYPLRTYHSLAASGALADHYFQPIIGASSSNDMFLARAGFVFQDNQAVPRVADRGGRAYTDPTIGDLLDARGVSWAVYMEGYAAWRAGVRPDYPAGYDPTDDPFNYYATSSDRTADYAELGAVLAAGTLPAVSLVRALGVRSEHPGDGTRITDGERWVLATLAAVAASAYADDTLVLLTWDEGGGYFDHVPPPLALADGTPLPRTTLAPDESGDVSHERHGGRTRVLPESKGDPEYYSRAGAMDGQEYYGTRLPLVAWGRFAKRNQISHVVMEHSSIVRFIEWNWLDDARLGTRDASVNGIGDLLDAAATGVSVP